MGEIYSTRRFPEEFMILSTCVGERFRVLRLFEGLGIDDVDSDMRLQEHVDVIRNFHQDITGQPGFVRASWKHDNRQHVFRCSRPKLHSICAIFYESCSEPSRFYRMKGRTFLVALGGCALNKSQTLNAQSKNWLRSSHTRSGHCFYANPISA